jgi:S-formylglutathione hydrolase FrmB
VRARELVKAAWRWIGGRVTSRSALLVVQGIAIAAVAPAWADPGPEAAGRWSRPVEITGTIDDRTVTAAMLVYLPRGYPAAAEPAAGAAASSPGAGGKHPLVIALHGWNHSPALVRDRGELARWADRYGLVIAVPAMKTTIYETRLYPQSRRAWAAVPGARWVGEVVLPYLRSHYAVSSDRAHTAVIGYSTGGRGAVLVAAAYPAFCFAGSVSGTFDLMRLVPADGEYKIHAVIYGPRDRFKDRWELDNGVSAARLAGLAGTQLFIAHGSKDRVVLPDQLDALRDALDGSAIKADFVQSPDGDHTWAYWNRQWEAMFRAMASAMGLAAAK